MGIFYKDKNTFGLDIGHSSLKLMQIDNTVKNPHVVGYGTVSFDSEAIDANGIVQDPEALAKAINELISKSLVGKLTTKRVVVSLPNSNSFSRVITLPQMNKKELADAVEAEVDQSIPLTNDELYFDWEVAAQLEHDMQEIQIVATPKKLVDSYMDVFDIVGLEVAALESNITAMTRIVIQSEAHDVSSLIVDIGSNACDISIYDGSAIRATGTVGSSSERMTKHIADTLGVSEEQAHRIKTRYGLEKSKKQDEIIAASEKELTKLVMEIKKVIRYYADRSRGSEPIGQIIILGGGANLPGLASYLTDKTRVPTRLCSPWNNISFGKLQPPHELETTLYTTASGLALVTKEDLVR